MLKSPPAAIPAKSARLLAPIQNPGMGLSCGMNYYEHLKEMKTPVPQKPAAFTKSVASIIGPGEPIVLPPSNPAVVDWEGEFSVVIGKPCHRVAAAAALDYVAGYTIVNDVSARDWGGADLFLDRRDGSDPRVGAQSPRQDVPDVLPDGPGAGDAR